MKTNIFLVCLTSILTLMALVYLLISRGMAIYMLGILAIPIGIFLINHQKFLYAAIICTSFSNLTFPGLPGVLKIFHLLAIVAFVSSVLGCCIRKENRRKLTSYQVFALLFCVNIFIIMMMRGTGLRISGGDRVGGMGYLEVLIPFGLLFTNPTFAFSKSDWHKIAYLFLFFSALPFLAELLFIASKGLIYFHYYFIKFNMSTSGTYFSLEAGEELVRFQTANKISPYLVMAAFGCFLSKRCFFLGVLLYMTSVFLVGISGHRSGFIDLVLLTWVGGFFMFRKNKLGYVFCSAAVSIILIAALYFIAPLLPYNFQRVLSILPGIDISTEARMNALSTINWRLQLWHEAWNEIRLNPKYLLIGKGLTYSLSEFNALKLFDMNYWWGILTSNYHHGFFDLVIITGVPGLISGVGLFITGLIEKYKIQKRHFMTSELSVMHVFLYSYLAIIIARFFIVYGSITTSIPMICILYFITDMMEKTLESPSPLSSELQGAS